MPYFTAPRPCLPILLTLTLALLCGCGSRPAAVHLVVFHVDRIDGKLCLTNDDENMIVALLKQNPKLTPLIKTFHTVPGNTEFAVIYGCVIGDGPVTVDGHAITLHDPDIGSVVLMQQPKS